MNGYLEYQENSKNYDIKDETIDYKTGIKFIDFKKKYNINDFSPATFILITGTDENTEDIPEVKQKIIAEVFNSNNNIDGKLIKICLGSKVMNEGVTLQNIKEIHILDVHYNLGKVDQVIGRGIRMCKHINSITDENKFPAVNIYRYVVSHLEKKNNKLTKKEKIMAPLTSDEILYQKAELKYLTVKNIEHALKEIAIDCPLLLNGNIFPEELEKSKGCVYPTLENVKAGKKICPVLCDFHECDLKCDSKKLNDKYYDEKEKTYKLNLKDLDFNTFNDNLAKYEITYIKNIIKDMYRFKHVHLYKEILDEIIKSIDKHKIELFDEYFLDQAIEDMMPKSENDFNNFKDTIFDKYNRPGYLIQRGKYYIFQPFDENEDVSMFYRENIKIIQPNLVSINNYIKQKFGNKIIDQEEDKETDISNTQNNQYNFEDVYDYYNKREENFIVGIIDKNINKLVSTEDDLFKIREPRSKILTKKRATGIPSEKGCVCSVKDKSYLIKIIQKLDSDKKNKTLNLTKDQLCKLLKEKLLFLEKYSTSKEGNKLTYIFLPSNHPVYPFPYNLEDRCKDRINKINNITQKQNNISVKHINNQYILTFNDEKFNKDDLNNLGCKLNKNEWTLILN
jgi:hypothetical protein